MMPLKRTQLCSIWYLVSMFFPRASNAFLSHRVTLRNVPLSQCQLLQVLPWNADADVLLEDVSWTDLTTYEGLPGLSLLGVTLSLLALRLRPPPTRLLSEQELQEITVGTFLQGRSDVTCLYKATRDGWSAVNFHDKVDGLGSAVVVARSVSGQIFGGYNPAGWRSTDDYVTSTAAFLWAKQSGGQRFRKQASSQQQQTAKIIKFPVLAGGNAAIFDYATSGPTFGASDLQIGPPRAAVLGGFAGPDTVRRNGQCLVLTTAGCSQ